MADSKPWFLVMTSTNANQPGSGWTRKGFASRGKVVATPIAPEGWAVLGIFVVVSTLIPFLLWGLGFAAGNLSTTAAVLTTIVAELAVVAGFIFVVWKKSTRLGQ